MGRIVKKDLSNKAAFRAPHLVSLQQQSEPPAGWNPDVLWKLCPAGFFLTLLPCPRPKCLHCLHFTQQPKDSTLLLKLCYRCTICWTSVLWKAALAQLLLQHLIFPTTYFIIPTWLLRRLSLSEFQTQISLHSPLYTRCLLVIKLPLPAGIWQVYVYEWNTNI